MIKKTRKQVKDLHETSGKRVSRTVRKRFEAYDDGDLIDGKIFNMSVSGAKGTREIDNEIKALIRFIKTGRGITSTGIVSVGDDYANRRSAGSRLKKILVACKKNDLLTDDDIVELLRGLTDNKEVAKAMDVLATIKSLGLSEDYPGVADLIASTQTGFGDIDDKSTEHGIGAHHHQSAYSDLEDPDSPYMRAKKRVAGIAPDDAAQKKSKPGKRQDWERSAYRVIAEDEAAKYVSMLRRAGRMEAQIDESAPVPSDTETLIDTLKVGFGGMAVNPTGRRWLDQWDGDPSQEEYGLDTEHCMRGGVAIDCSGKTEGQPWKTRFVIYLCVPYIGSLDDPENKEYDLNAFCVAVTVRNVTGSQVRMQQIMDRLERTFKANVKRRGAAYGCSLVDNVYYTTSICKAPADEHEESLRYLVRCACAAFGECLDVIEGVDPDDVSSVRTSINQGYVENKSMSKVMKGLSIKRRLERKAELTRRMECRKRSRFEGRDYEPDHGCINDSSDGSNLYLVGLWPGAGYRLSTMLVWAGAEWEALDIAAWWARENAPGLVASEEQVTELKEELLAELLRDDPEKYLDEVPEDIDDLTDSDLCGLLRKQNADLFYDTMYEVEESQEFQETYMYHDGGVYTWAQEGMCREVNPDDYADIIYDGLEMKKRRCKRMESRVMRRVRRNRK